MKGVHTLGAGDGFVPGAWPVVITKLLDGEKLKTAQDLADLCPFERGEAPGAAGAVKQNYEARAGSREPDVVSEPRENLLGLVAHAVASHEVLQRYAYARRVRAAIVNRYETGDHYGPHVDAHHIAGARADFSFSVVLEVPGAGGQLYIEGVRIPYLEPGDAIVYPTGPVHEVGAVGGGRRTAVVGWAESMVPDPSLRAWLVQLDTTRRQLEADGHARAALDVNRVYQEAFRRFTR